MTLFQSKKTKSWVGRRRWGGRNKNKRKEKEEQWWEGRKEGRKEEGYGPKSKPSLRSQFS